MHKITANVNSFAVCYVQLIATEYKTVSQSYVTESCAFIDSLIMTVRIEYF